ncbi:hypothetical protein [Spirosoma endophyticum]|uniref:hypothetical protein n=1 Tax=Spirosoma endophyticum TaxID=662367 RepID=UPI000B82C173|nr:hypothetical protein [Spirosoma endophyticum]
MVIDGLWDLVQTINQYRFLTVVDKYAVAYHLLKEILAEDSAKLEECADASLTGKTKENDLTDTGEVINNPRSWDLTGESTFTLSTTDKGKHYLKNFKRDEVGNCIADYWRVANGWQRNRLQKPLTHLLITDKPRSSAGIKRRK